jgi:hypothetical protein
LTWHYDQHNSCFTIQTLCRFRVITLTVTVTITTNIFLFLSGK